MSPVPAIALDDYFEGAWLERVKRQNTPLMGTIELSFRCNVRCQHCYVTYNVEPDNRELDTGELRRILDEISAAGCLWLLFTGGEPFLRPDFLDLLAHAKRRGLLVTIFTNGTLLDEDTVARLAEWPPHRLEITLYGMPEETYERVTRRKGSWRRCLDGIDRLLAAGLPLRLKAVLMEDNQHELPAMRAFARERGLRFAHDANINSRIDGNRAPCSLRVEPEQVLEIEEAIDPGLAARWRGLQSATARGLARAEEENRLFHCGAGIHSFWIDPYGRLQLCGLTRRNHYDLRRGNFAEGYFVHLPRLRNRPASPGYECARCDLLSACGQCPGMAELEHGDPEKRVDYLCRLTHARAARYGLRHERCGCPSCELVETGAWSGADPSGSGCGGSCGCGH